LTYKGNQIDYRNLNDNLKTKIDKAEGIESQVQALTPKVDNSWQKGVYNDTYITNLGPINATKTISINQSDWKNTENVEQLDIYLPITGAFSGLIKATYTSTWGNEEANGGAEVVYEIGSFTEPYGTRLNKFTITTASESFMRSYRILNPYIDVATGNIVLILLKAPNATNPFKVKLEIQGYFHNTTQTAFDVFKIGTFATIDKGSPTFGGYPWTPQTSNIPTSADFGKWNAGYDAYTRFQGNCVLVSDWNNITQNGMYMSGENTPNAPVTNWCMGIHTSHNDLWMVQKVISFAGDGDNREYERRKQGGVWGAWVETSPMKLFTSVSDGKTKVASAISDKGVYTSPIETFDNMAKNIRLIQTGRKNARGSGTLQRVGQHLRIVATGLSFKPSIILVSRTGIQETNTMWKSMYADGNAFMPITTSINMYTYYNSRDTSYNTVHGALAYISNSGFEMNIASYVQGVDETGTYSWIAFE